MKNKMNPKNPRTKEMNQTTLVLIRNLKQMGLISFAIDDLLNKYLLVWCLEKRLLPSGTFSDLVMSDLTNPPMPILVDFVKKKKLISFAIHDLCEKYLQEWCISKGIVTNDYIAGFRICSTVEDAEKTSIECIICGRIEVVKFPAGLPDHEITTLFENKGWDMEKEKCPKCNQ